LFVAAQYGGPDAAALLAFTYQVPAMPAPGGLSLPALPRRSEEMPAAMAAHLDRVAPPGANTPEEVLERDHDARVYFTHVALREPPDIVLIPGDWSKLVSPAVLLALQVQNAR
jgi:hypothetical protein